MKAERVERHGAAAFAGGPSRDRRAAAGVLHGVAWLLVAAAVQPQARSAEPEIDAGLEAAPPVTAARDAEAASRLGLDLLLAKGYLPPDFDQEVFDDLWTVWEEPARSRAESLPLADRRRMALARYGVVAHPDAPSRSLQYAVDEGGAWRMMCLACHQGVVDGVLHRSG
ncbi:MAG: hypothetical protein ACKOTB_19335, partial [Planctomycetia bacterium]